MEARRAPATRPEAPARTADRLDVNRETPRNRVTQAEVDADDRPGTTTEQAQRLAEPERGMRGLRRAGAICGRPRLSSRRSSTAHTPGSRLQ
ncbi:transposase-like protein [Spinactinospora alkalitolerans]|uniref:Transposase-like protein n=1 Tax=Spinactinospora alkalitolerans TaxID=687207 RepID=A0A852U0X7_9ACTN|nr:transposase-like protein [Spinactinospora alkalitolerans]